MAIEWTDVPHSSNISRVGFDPDTDSTIVEFTGGAQYTHPGMGRAEAEALAADASPGSYYHRHVKGRYTARKL